MYELLPEEVEYLDASYPKWEKLSEDKKYGLLIVGFPVPDGYAPTNGSIHQVELMLIIPQSYPAVNLDMFYFFPPLKKNNEQKIEKLQNATHFGRPWQMWSRHYPWTPGKDNLISHIEFVKSILEKEAQQ